MPRKGADFRSGEKIKNNLTYFGLKCLLLITSSDVKSRVSGESWTGNINWGPVHKGHSRDDIKKFIRTFQNQGSKDE